MDYTEKPKRKNRGCRPKLSSLLVSLSIFGCIASFAYLMFVTVFAMDSVANDLLVALRDEDYAAAYELMVDDVQDNYETGTSFAETLRRRELPAITGWFINNTEASGSTIMPSEGHYGTARGSIDFQYGPSGQVLIYLEYSEDAWHVRQVIIFREDRTLTIP